MIETISRCGQDVDFERLDVFHGQKIRIAVRSNSFESQCRAALSVWNAVKLEWSEVVRIHPGSMMTRVGLYAMPRETWRDPKHFEMDVTELLEKAHFVLS